MSYDYEHSVPFTYNKYRTGKEYVLTDEIKSYLNDFFMYIKVLDEGDILSTGENSHIDKIDALVQVLSNKYRELREKYIKPCIEEKYNYKMYIFVSDEVDFIFACSYLLIKKFGLSQAKLAQIFGMRANTFSKIGCFPYRAYNAYTKLDDVSARKSLIPNDSNSIGIQIAACINKKVQTYYLCSGFVGVSNDLDLFANISATDKKSFILTSPMNFNDNDISAIKRAKYAFARYNFALGNQLFNDIDSYVPAGEIKRKIMAMLKMEESYVLSSEEEQQILIQLFLSDKDLKGFLLTGKRYSEFEEVRKEFRAYYDSMNIEREKLEDGFENFLLEYYDEKFEISTTRVREKDNNIDADADDIVRKYYLKYKEKVERLEQELLSYIDSIKICKLENISLQDWIQIISRSVKSNLLFNRQSSERRGGTVGFLEPTYDDRLRSAASYWISEVFANYDGNEVFYNNVLRYLGKKSPLYDYFDVLNAPPSGKMKQASSNERANIHVYMRDEQFDILNELTILEEKKRLASDDNTPILVYIDADSYYPEEGIYKGIQSLFLKWKIVVVVHDKDGVLSSQLDILDKNLGLYISTNVEEL